MQIEVLKQVIIQELGRKQASLNLNKYSLRGQAPEILLVLCPSECVSFNLHIRMVTGTCAQHEKFDFHAVRVRAPAPPVQKFIFTDNSSFIV